MRVMCRGRRGVTFSSGRSLTMTGIRFGKGAGLRCKRILERGSAIKGELVQALQRQERKLVYDSEF